jgi:hypothetical protein
VQQPLTAANDLATSGTCVFVARVLRRANDDCATLDADFDLGIWFDADLLENRLI